MKTAELRIGNLVYTVNRNTPVHLPYYVSLKVLTIETTGCRLLSPDLIPAQVEEWPLFQHFDICEIQLTEEWLDKFGFVKRQGLQVWKKSHYSIKPYFTVSQGYFKDRYELNDISGAIPFTNHNDLRYVHQLQNLWYALTGTDLTIPVSEKPLSEGA